MIDWKSIWDVLSDWKVYCLLFANWSQAVPNYALKFTMPTIIKQMGFTSANAQLLTIPPYAIGALASFGFSWMADKRTWRMPFVVIPQITLVIAFAILFSKSDDIKNNIPVLYFAVCLCCFGIYPIFPGVNAWNIANGAGPAKRAASIGFMVGMGNAGGVISSYIYKANEAPRYPTGYGTSFAFASAGIIACFVLEYGLWKSNQKNAKFSEEDIRIKYSDEELERMGDRSPLFKYAL
jgi:hypothetical protein